MTLVVHYIIINSIDTVDYGTKNIHQNNQQILLTIKCRLPVDRRYDFTEGGWRQREINSDMTGVVICLVYIQSSCTKHILTCQLTGSAILVGLTKTKMRTKTIAFCSVKLKKKILDLHI